MTTGKALVIVESPAKAKTIAGYLGSGFMVESSIGHIRDLPKSAEDVPAHLKGTELGKLGVDVENDFAPLYVVDSDKKQHIGKLKKLLAEADTLYLATDEDREGEAIAWHLFEVLKPKVPVHRMVFHEITKKAIQDAIKQPRTIDRRLVNAQEARRVLDRLYGWEVSPVLWKKVMPRLSAGRVQSVATRILVERERERRAFVSASYWDLSATLVKTKREDGDKDVEAQLIGVGGKRLATGKDFDSKGTLTRKDALLLPEKEARALAAGLDSATAKVSSVERKPYRRSPSAPFMTSTLQQEASRKLRFSAQRTMKAAQRLYENGYITYMRTDSTTLSDTAIAAARSQIASLYGKDYLPATPRTYANKVKNAQEAHEAIRPAGDDWKLPDEVTREVDPDQAKVYELVWKRTVASQMQDARGESVSVRFAATAKTDQGPRECELSAAGLTIEFPGFLRAYVEGSDDPEAELESKEKQLPKLVEGDALTATDVSAAGHETQPPARYTEASLVRKLEELGVGRPSTYAATLATIQDRGYVLKKGTALAPSFTAFAVVTLLERHFPELVDYAFTAKMENDLDAIASGENESAPWLRRFYFGVQAEGAANESHVKTAGTTGVNAHRSAGLEVGLRKLVSEHLGDIDAREINSIYIGKDAEDRDVVARVGRYGVYVQRGEDTATVPEDVAPDELTIAKALELISAPSGGRELGTDPKTNLPVYVRAGRFGAYVMLGDPKMSEDKPKTASLFRAMSPSTVTLADALKLLELPRTVGVGEDGESIVAQNGKYGPYISKGKETRSLGSEDELFTVTTEQALVILAQPKTRPGRQARGPVAPLKELGEDPVSKKTITVRDGRFGAYVSDGDTHATLRKGDSPETITPERAQELLAERRERGPSTGKGKKPARGKGGGGFKKAAAKKSSKAAPEASDDGEASETPKPAKKAATKKAPKKAAAKKAAPSEKPPAKAKKASKPTDASPGA
ncbi:MAG: type I DNA topoisomerase [Deltaproteobacteria bacterium]|nr:type I DNA topoisomerase [Deltaproteobacteria bacterium]